MCACFCIKLCMKNVDTWKITIDIIWSYSGSTFATNKVVAITVNNKTSESYYWSINCTDTTSSRSGGAGCSILTD